MPTLFFADMVREMSSTTGTGAFSLDGPTPGHRSFASVIPAGATFPYAICGVSDESQWEVGEGTLSPSGALNRSPKASSAGGAAVNFGAGLKTVTLTVCADWYAARDAVAGHSHDLSSVTGLESALAAKQPATGTMPITDAVQSDDRLALRRGASDIAILGSHVVARRTAGGPFKAEGSLLVDTLLGVGITSPLRALHAKHAINAVGAYTMVLEGATSAYGAGVSFQSQLGGGGALTEMARITADGESSWTTTQATQLAGLRFYTMNAGTVAERLRIHANGVVRPGSDNAQTLGAASNRWGTIFSGTGSISTSDERAKGDIEAIPDAWLDAWGDVEWSRYRFIGGNRWHIGLVAQRVHAAFKARGLDAFDIGLCCYDRWEADGDTPEGDRWGLRYDECFALEAAWVRRELNKKSDKRSVRRAG